MSETLSATMAPPRRPTLHFDALYRESRSDVYAYVASLVGAGPTAEDVVAVAFERAYRKRRGFNPSRGTPRQWLFAIARNAALDELRRRARSATPVADAGVHVAADAPASSEADERSEAVRAALHRLHPRDRELIALKFFAGLSNDESPAPSDLRGQRACARPPSPSRPPGGLRMSLLHRTQSTSEPVLSPDDLAELEALDAALAGETIDDNTLAQFVRDVQAAAPHMDLDAAQRLTGRVAAGFPAKAGRRRLRLPVHGPAGVAREPLRGRRADRRRRRRALPERAAVGGVQRGEYPASAPAAASSSPGAAAVRRPHPLKQGTRPTISPRRQCGPRGAFSPTSATEQSASAGAGSSKMSAPADIAVEGISREAAAPTTGPAAAESADRTTGRAVERSVDLAVRVKSGRLQEAAGRVSQITRQANGYIADSQLSLGTQGRGTATFTLRVDAARLDQAIDRLSALGTVTSQNQSSRDNHERPRQRQGAAR